MTRHYYAAAVALLALVRSAIAAPKSRTLGAEEVRQVLIGKVITDGAHWQYYLKPNGAIDAFEMGRERTGHWHLNGNRLCIAIKAGAAPDQCFDVMREGKSLVFGVHGRGIYDVTVEVPRH